MSIPLYLAMTAAEFSTAPALPPRIAWMAMHFPVSGPGLSGRPHRLPPGSLVLLDDLTPWCGHSLESVCQETIDVLLRTGAAGLLLDFERPPTEETLRLANCLTQCCREAGCPIGMPPGYLDHGSEAAVFLPPLPCHRPPEQVLEPFQGREIWLEAATCGCRVALGPDGPSLTLENPQLLEAESESMPTFTDPHLHCRYYSRLNEAGVELALYDTWEMLTRKLEHCQALGVTLAVGIWKRSPLSGKRTT